MIWKLRAMPMCTRACAGRPVMSRPSNQMRPALGRQLAGELRDQRGLAGAVRPDHGVGLAMATMRSRSVGRDHAAEGLAETFGAQQRVIARSLSHRPPRARSAAAVPRTRPGHRQQARAGRAARTARSPAARGRGRSASARPSPALEPSRSSGMNSSSRISAAGAEHRADHRAHAAEDHHHDQLARAGPGEIGRADEAGGVGEQNAGEACEHARDDEGDQPVAEHRIAERRSSAARCPWRRGSPGRTASARAGARVQIASARIARQT